MAQCPCGNQRHTTRCDDALVVNYAQMLREAGFQTKIEPRNEFVLIDGTEKRADLQVYNYKGRKACFDVSVTHPALLPQLKGPTPCRRQEKWRVNVNK